jgi:hypothetical protein
MRRSRWVGSIAIGLTCVLLAPPAQAIEDADGSAATPVLAAGPSQQELARSALRGSLRENDPHVLDERLRQAHRIVADRAARAPDEFGSASVVFNRGLDVADVTGLVSRWDLDLLTAEAKVPAGDVGEVYTLWFSDFARFDGPMSQKLERAIGKVRFRYFRQASIAPPDRRDTLRELAQGDMRFYRLELVGRHASFAALVGDPSVMAVLPDRDARKVEALHELRAYLDSVEREAGPAPALPEVRLRSGDPARGTAGPGVPVLTNSGLSCTWQTADAILACQPSAPPSISGDPTIDHALPRRDGGAAAGTTTASRSGLGAVPQADTYHQWIVCGLTSALPNEKCPNDHTYRPHPDTDGEQAFAAVVYSYQEGWHLFYDCYVYWVEDEAGGYWETVCYPYEVYTPAYTIGAAEWYSRWGTRKTTVPELLNSQVEISTMAFQDAFFPMCDVENTVSEAYCDPVKPNSTWVPLAGIEDELLLPNPACLRDVRQGDPSDWDKGCFWPTIAVSNLPAAFLDTTFSDVTLVDDPTKPSYNLAIGSADPGRIVEGTLYGHYAEFFAYGTNNVVGRAAWHAVSVDSKIPTSAACTLGGGADAFCYFPVDSSRVSSIVTFQ